METLITLILMGLAILGILTGLASLSRLSSAASETTQVRNTAQSYAELLKQPVDAATGVPTYVHCATAATLPAPDPDMVPDGYTVEIERVEYATNMPTATSSALAFAWSTTCPANDRGLQRIQVRVESNGLMDRSETVTVIKRDQSCVHTYTNVDLGPC